MNRPPRVHRPTVPRRLVLGAVVLCVASLVACARGPERIAYTFDGPTMGTGYTVKIVRDAASPLDEARQQRLSALLEERMEEVNQLMSTYLDDSELSRFNRSPGETPVTLSPLTVDVLHTALELSESTGGALDVTVGPLVNAWGFGPKGHDPMIDLADLEPLLRVVGHDKLLFDPGAGTLAKTTPEVFVDLSSVAKGYAVDRVYAALRAEGIDDVFVEIGGETRVHGANAEGRPWRLGIERPQELRAVQRIIELRDAAVATSGDYRNYREENGVRLSHLIDPRSGRPIRHRLASVTVVRPTCLEADGLATALMILGPDEGFAFAEREQIPALFLVREGEGFAERATAAFTARFDPTSPEVS